MSASRICIIRLLPFLIALAHPGLAEGAKHKVPSEYPTINAAIAAAANGDTIVISAGVYAEVVSVGLRSGLTIKGKGEVVIDGGGAPHAVGFGLCSDIRLQGVAVRNAAVALAQVTTCYGLVIEDCTFDGGTADGLVVEGGERVEIVDCTFQDIPGVAVQIGSSSSYLGASRILRSGHGGSVPAVRVHGEMVTVENNDIEDDGVGPGLMIGYWEGDSRDMLVVANRISDTGADGIAIVHTTNCTILGNVIRDVEDDGIDVDGSSFESRIIDNRVVGAGSDGIETGGDHEVHMRNRVKKAGRDGVWVTTYAAHSHFFKNRIKLAGRHGFYVDGDEHAFLKNHADGSLEFDLVDLGISNEFLGNHFGAIQP